jgi:hypothetical protein
MNDKMPENKKEIVQTRSEARSDSQSIANSQRWPPLLKQKKININYEKYIAEAEDISKITSSEYEGKSSAEESSTTEESIIAEESSTTEENILPEENRAVEKSSITEASNTTYEKITSDENIIKDETIPTDESKENNDRRQRRLKRRERRRDSDSSENYYAYIQDKKINSVSFEMNDKGVFVNGKPFDPQNPPDGVAITADQKTAKS